jgi:DNA-binding response OmpR family regulator
MTSILIYGRDANLLETRAQVLEQAGHRVRTVASLDALHRMLSTEQADLLILCHSLSMEDCGRSIALTIRWPQTKSLILTVGLKGYDAQIEGLVLDMMNGPTKLVSAVGKLVHPESKAHTHIY